jgi:hypothetical protein
MVQREICKRKKQVEQFLMETTADRRETPISGWYTISARPAGGPCAEGMSPDGEHFQ